jgi:hypothetical protein
MTAWRPDEPEVEALRTDHYLDALLGGTELVTPGVARQGVDPAVADSAASLQRDLVRVHPSFRFEERLARRLADIAASMRLPAAAGAEGQSMVSLPTLPFRGPDADDPASDAFDPDAVDGSPVVSRPVLIGGAVASAALSIAGAAIVAWRFGRLPTSDPMSRAVRAAHGARVRRARTSDLGG